MPAMRIWHQSFTDLDSFPRYRDTLASHADRVMQGRAQVRVHGLRPGSYPAGIAPMDVNSVAALRLLGEAQVCDAALAAQAAGYDAFALGCFFDPALEAARSLVDIPVASLTESCLLTACSLGRRFAVVSVTPFQKMLTEDLVARYGLRERAAGVVSMSPAVRLFDLEREEASRDIAEAFHGACDEALRLGAEVIIPGDGVLNEFLVRHGWLGFEGAAVLDALGVLFLHAEFLARGRAVGALDVSRRRLYAKPEESMLAHARRFYGAFVSGEADFSGAKA
ncbi:MAG: aspartate/glutamate racemase family protein [Mobilitalea sp.]